MSSAIVWFRRDLRLDDNPAWAAATSLHHQVIPLLVIEPGLLDRAGPFRRAAFLAAAHRLGNDLQRLGGSLFVLRGDPSSLLPPLLHEHRATAVYANADVSRWARRRDREVDHTTGGAVVWSWGTLVHPPGTVLTNQGNLSRVFTPFFRRWLSTPIADEAVHGVASITNDPGVGLPPQPAAELISPTPDWSTAVDRYDTLRDLPSEAGTSRLSTALRFGEVSPRRLIDEIGSRTKGREAFLRQLAWRDWYAHTTFVFPDIDRRAIRPAFDTMAWERGDDADRDFAAWKAGKTGYPIVDAGMRELAATGWMHNRIRMIAASFLVKDLLIDWRRGERYFRHILSDAEPAQNAGNWQWVAGTGPDAAPYFRVLNPVTQSRRFDPEGAYIRRWVPELDRVASRAIHAPWETPPLDLAAAGVTLGRDYPAPIIDHAWARERALAAYSAALGT